MASVREAFCAGWETLPDAVRDDRAFTWPDRRTPSKRAVERLLRQILDGPLARKEYSHSRWRVASVSPRVAAEITATIAAEGARIGRAVEWFPILKDACLEWEQATGRIVTHDRPEWAMGRCLSMGDTYGEPREDARAIALRYVEEQAGTVPTWPNVEHVLRTERDELQRSLESAWAARPPTASGRSVAADDELRAFIELAMSTPHTVAPGSPDAERLQEAWTRVLVRNDVAGRGPAAGLSEDRDVAQPALLGMENGPALGFYPLDRPVATRIERLFKSLRGVGAPDVESDESPTESADGASPLLADLTPRTLVERAIAATAQRNGVLTASARALLDAGAAAYSMLPVGSPEHQPSLGRFAAGWNAVRKAHHRPIAGGLLESVLDDPVPKALGRLWVRVCRADYTSTDFDDARTAWSEITAALNSLVQELPTLAAKSNNAEASIRRLDSTISPGDDWYSVTSAPTASGVDLLAPRLAIRPESLVRRRIRSVLSRGVQTEGARAVERFVVAVDAGHDDEAAAIWTRWAHDDEPSADQALTWLRARHEPDAPGTDRDRLGVDLAAVQVVYEWVTRERRGPVTARANRLIRNMSSGIRSDDDAHLWEAWLSGFIEAEVGGDESVAQLPTYEEACAYLFALARSRMRRGDSAGIGEAS